MSIIFTDYQSKVFKKPLSLKKAYSISFDYNVAVLSYPQAVLQGNNYLG